MYWRQVGLFSFKQILDHNDLNAAAHFTTGLNRSGFLRRVIHRFGFVHRDENAHFCLLIVHRPYQVANILCVNIFPALHGNNCFANGAKIVLEINQSIHTLVSAWFASVPRLPVNQGQRPKLIMQVKRIGLIEPLCPVHIKRDTFNLIVDFAAKSRGGKVSAQLHRPQVA